MLTKFKLDNTYDIGAIMSLHIDRPGTQDKFNRVNYLSWVAR